MKPIDEAHRTRSRVAPASSRAAASSEIGFPESSAPFQFRGLPERAFACAPSGIGERHWWKSLVQTHQPLHIGHTQILDEHTQGPAIGNGMMNREDQNVIVGAPPKHFDPVKRSSDQIEWLAENLFRQLFDRLFVSSAQTISSRKRKLASLLWRIICTGRSLPGRKERRITSCRSTTR